MTVVTGAPADVAAIRPFTFEAAEADLEDLRRRIAAMRWPQKEPVPRNSTAIRSCGARRAPRSHGSSFWFCTSARASRL